MTHKKVAASVEFSNESVAAELARQGQGGDPVGAQIFFEEGVAAESLNDTASYVIQAAEESLGRPGSVTLGKVRTSAMSASVSGDPEVIAAIQNSPAVKTVLPNQIDDILPKPQGRKAL
ncbi:MAG: hypothetical protein JWR51_3430 [Devosia sp.]|uniref:hypothetical protein n=1 Tax=Devosia sp. TaxID=1871048 RepID=UPI00261E1264|nr:hypothetical protein [Devosia sp.]MDB5530327.1 hypothetical protein [Devosia sp.]